MVYHTIEQEYNGLSIVTKDSTYMCKRQLVLLKCDMILTICNASVL